MKLKELKRDLFLVPKWLGNDKEKPEDQIKIVFSRFPSGAEIGIYKKFRWINDATEVIYDNVKVIINHVESIENLEIGKVKIDTDVKLCDHPDARLYDLIIEIRRYLMEVSEEIPEGED